MVCVYLDHKYCRSNLTFGLIFTLQAGDSIPADAIIFTPGIVACNESALTGTKIALLSYDLIHIVLNLLL